MRTDVVKNLRFNVIVNLVDGGFFGFGIGFASFATILPLFVSRLTDSAVLIGLIPAIHNMGWMLPQLLVARRVAQQRQFKRFVLLATIQERLPFIGLGITALLLPVIGNKVALLLVFILLIWQGLGAGVAANPWQNFIANVFPADYLGRFFGFQAAAANSLSSVGAIVAGVLLERVDEPLNFAYCFFACFGLMSISYVFLSLTRESDRVSEPQTAHQSGYWKHVGAILKQNGNFRSFLVSRILMQFALMSSAFYTVYAVKVHGMGETAAGVMTSVLMLGQMFANPLLGWLADRWSRQKVLMIGGIASVLGAFTAWLAPDLGWFYLVMILTAIANASFWSIGLAQTLTYGTEDERPVYVGLANTLIAPAAILAPVLGGWLADLGGYSLAFITAGGAGIITSIVLAVFVSDRR